MNLSPPTTINVTWLKKPSRHLREISLASSVAVPLLSLCTSGANFSCRWSGKWYNYNNFNYIQTFPHMHMSIAIMTTTNIHVFQLRWRHWYMISHTNVELMQNTEKRRLSLAHPWKTISVGNSG
jgi:hypothetical protein